jgi:hypothetical protein
MARPIDPAAATQKWLTNIGNSGPAVRAGVAALQTSPGASAAAAADKWLARVTQAKAKFKARVGSVSLTDWQNAMNTYGIDRISAGAQAKQGKMLSYMTEVAPYIAAGQAKVDRMPSTTLDDNIQRMVTMVRHMSDFKRSGT